MNVRSKQKNRGGEKEGMGRDIRLLNYRSGTDYHCCFEEFRIHFARPKADVISPVVTRLSE